MKCLGLIGGASATDLDTYWKTIRSEFGKLHGGRESPEVLIYSLPGRPLRDGLQDNDWPHLGSILTEAGAKLTQIGAECLVICGSALNPGAPALQNSLEVPVVDLSRSVQAKLQSLKYRKVAILGIRTAAELDMWQQSLDGIRVLTPAANEGLSLLRRADEAITGHPPTIEWKIETNQIVSSLRRGGAQALILAEPALARWIRPGDSLLYPIDASEIHAWTAALWAFNPDSRPGPPCIALL